LLFFVRLAKDLIHEAQMHRLRHPNIVMLLAVIFEPQHYGVVFEYVTYGGLDSFIEDYLVGFQFVISVNPLYACLAMQTFQPNVFNLNVWHGVSRSRS